jgi:hypothetical protein
MTVEIDDQSPGSLCGSHGQAGQLIVFVVGPVTAAMTDANLVVNFGQRASCDGQKAAKLVGSKTTESLGDVVR